MVSNNRSRNIDTAPPGYARAQTQLGIVSISEQILVESANRVEHFATVHSGAAIGPQRFFQVVVLADVGFAAATAAILSIGIYQVACFIDPLGIFPNQDLRSRHAEISAALEGID